MRRIYLLPNLFTAASLFCGLLAILNIYNVAGAPEEMTWRYEMSCWLILLAAVLDLLDGWVARMTHTESAFGVQFDSLADVVAFGVAPAILIYTRLVNMENRQLADVITTLFAISGALRLARFNVQKAKTERKSFTGLPIPAAAGTIVSSYLFFQRIDPDWNNEFILKVLPFLVVGLSYLMVSKVNYPSFKQLDLERKKSFDVLLRIIIVLIIIGVALKMYLYALVFFGFAGYVLWGLTARAWSMVRQPKQKPADRPTPY